MPKFRVELNQRISGESADTWVETYDTLEQVEARREEVRQKKIVWDPGYSLEILSVEQVEE
jgi:hypothetical protein